MPLPVSHQETEEEEIRRMAIGATAGPRNARPVLDRRHSQRVPLHLHVLYTSDQDDIPYDGEGQVQNLSKKGCQIRGTVRLAQGSRVTLFLDLKDGRLPLCLPAATVCWSDGETFSVKFPPMTNDARYRLQQIVLKFAAQRTISRTHTAFTIRK